jgi:D-lactate dehydrogenase
MKVALFSAQPYDERFFGEVLHRDYSDEGCTITYFAARLDADTVALAHGFNAICVFVNEMKFSCA